ncbi:MULTISPECIES: inositol monophosphatase family protein [unclassified Arthrobacter]|uniref:inositol monophosphatase family protein n=1 Tax=unclassified Arthrobacter TaxID=235627 RepID=UPI002157EA22|nr:MULTISPECIES: inositol monophosphatase family protein [unclassified Arthrobacter]
MNAQMTPTRLALAESLRQAALIAALKAAPQVREAFRGSVGAEEKTNAHDLVTDVDRQSQEIITQSLREAFPKSWVLGEENIAADSGIASPTEVQWIVDPIDGTSNFVHGVAFFCISIAAAIDNELVAAAIVDPISGDQFSANSQAAYHNGELLSPGNRPEQARANLMTDYPGAESMLKDGPLALELFGQWIQDFATVRRKVSAALGLAHVAAGWCDASVGFDTKPWDVAAGAHLIRMSGGSYRGLAFGKQVAADHLCEGFIAQGPGADYESLARSASRVHQLRSQSQVKQI